MNYELDRRPNYTVVFTDPARVPRKEIKRLEEAKRDVFNETRMAALNADGVAAFTSHVGRRWVGLSEEFRSLAQTDDLGTVAGLQDLRAGYLRKVTKLQNDLFDEFGL